MKFILTLFFMVFILININAQERIVDTLDVVTLQKFDVPSPGALVLANILRLDFSAELLDANMNKIRDCQNFTQKPSKEDLPKATSGGRGTTVWIVIHETIENEGTFYIRANINANGETGAFRTSVLYMVNVTSPSMAAPIRLRPSYFFKENETFSFATVEYSDVNLYTYRIVDGGGSEVTSGTGPVVNLTDILGDLQNVGKKLTIIGMYQDKEFSFKSSNGENQTSRWDFEIAKPSFESFNGWASKDFKDEWYISIDNDFSKTFLFLYIGNLPGGGFATVTPEFRSPRVEAEPADFLSGSGVTVGRRGAFATLILQVNENFINSMQIGDSEDVKLKFTMRTQFNTNETLEVKATIIK